MNVDKTIKSVFETLPTFIETIANGWTDNVGGLNTEEHATGTNEWGYALMLANKKECCWGQEEKFWSRFAVSIDSNLGFF